MKKFKIKKSEKPPYEIDHVVLKRFDQRQTVFGRMLFDQTSPFYKIGMYDSIKQIIAQGKEGYTRLDFIRSLAAWTVYDYFYGAFSRHKLQGANNVMPKPDFNRYDIDTPAKISQELKKTALVYGASKVGICRLNQTWLYSHNMEGAAIKLPEQFKFAIVIAIAMDARAIAQSPAYAASTESGLGYSRSAFVIACLAEFIRYLGYEAFPMGNDTALSIPLAIDAGLGELGRLGLLVTPEYGPCVRLCKVVTDMPLVPDKPIEFGVADFCRKCKRCADACEVDAIQHEEEPSYRLVCASNNPGIMRWAVNHDRCYQFWIENGADCSKCIAACPFVSGKKK